MTNVLGRRRSPPAALSLRSGVLLVLAAIQMLSASLPWLSDDNDVIAFSAVSGSAALAAALIDRRNSWPWALAIAASIFAAVTAVAADGISSGDDNEGAPLGTAVLMCALVVVVAFLGAARTLATPEVGPVTGWHRTAQVQTFVIAACGLHAVLEGTSELFSALAVFVSATGLATARAQGRSIWPWTFAAAASAVSLAAYYPATSDYYDLAAPAARFQDSALPEVAVFVTGLVMLASAAWSFLPRNA